MASIARVPQEASPKPPGSSFDAAAAKRGDALFSGKAQCKGLSLSTSEKSDLVQYLLSLTFGPPSKGED